MLRILYAELRRHTLMAIRYPVESLASVAIFTIIFYGLLVGARFISISGLEMNNRVGVITTTYILWLSALTLFGSPAGELVNDAQTGTLEQWLMSGSQPALLCIYRVLGGFLQSMILVLIVLILLIMITGVHLNFTPAALVPIASVLLAAFGLGLGLGAYAMLVKRATVLISISQFLIFFLIAAPVDDVSGKLKSLTLLLPMASAAAMARNVLARQSGIDWIPSIAVIANGVIYLFLGALLLNFATRIAKKRGTIGNY